MTLTQWKRLAGIIVVLLAPASMLAQGPLSDSIAASLKYVWVEPMPVVTASSTAGNNPLDRRRSLTRSSSRSRLRAGLQQHQIARGARSWSPQWLSNWPQVEGDHRAADGCCTQITRALGDGRCFPHGDKGRCRDLIGVSGRDRVAKERLRPPKPVVCLSRDGELNSIPLRCQRCDAGGCRRWL